jgi:hypothetical protein
LQHVRAGADGIGVHEFFTLLERGRAHHGDRTVRKVRCQGGEVTIHVQLHGVLIHHDHFLNAVDQETKDRVIFEDPIQVGLYRFGVEGRAIGKLDALLQGDDEGVLFVTRSMLSASSGSSSPSVIWNKRLVDVLEHGERGRGSDPPDVHVFNIGTGGNGQ